MADWCLSEEKHYGSKDKSLGGKIVPCLKCKRKVRLLARILEQGGEVQIFWPKHRKPGTKHTRATRRRCC